MVYQLSFECSSFFISTSQLVYAKLLQNSKETVAFAVESQA